MKTHLLQVASDLMRLARNIERFANGKDELYDYFVTFTEDVLIDLEAIAMDVESLRKRWKNGKAGR